MVLFQSFSRGLAVVAVSAMVLAGCAQGTGPNKQQVGTVLGGALGGVVGSNVGAGTGRTAAIIGGTLLGAFAGSSIGQSLDKADMMYAQQAQQQAYNAPVGQTITWNNPQSPASGTITPVRDGYTAQGSYCREFQQTVTIGGQMETAYGTACKQPDGTWRIRN